MSWYVHVIKNYVNFTGRARRKEYWMFVLFNLIFALILGFVNGLIFGETPVLPIIYMLFIILPAIAVSIRRLHDIGKSGWWYLIQLVPLVGSIWLLVLTVTAGNVGENQYGPDPKAVPEA